MEAALRRRDAKLIERILGRHHPIYKERTVLSFNYLRLFIYYIGKVACDNLKQVRLSDNPFQDPVFVDDGCQATGAFLNWSRTLKILIAS